MSNDDPTLVRSAQAIEIAWGFIVLIAIGVIYAFTKVFFGEMEKTFDDHTTNQTLQTGLDWTVMIFDHFLIIAAAVSVLGVIALSVYQSRGY